MSARAAVGMVGAVAIEQAYVSRCAAGTVRSDRADGAAEGEIVSGYAAAG